MKDELSLNNGPSAFNPNWEAEIVALPPSLSVLPLRRFILRTDDNLSPYKTGNPPVEKEVSLTKSRLI